MTAQAIAIAARASNVIAGFPAWLSLFALRAALAVPFYFSGLTKWDGFLRLSEGAAFLFADEFKLNLFGRAFDFPFPALSAWVTGTLEIVLPGLLVIGLATRFAAAGLLAMTVVIQLVVPDGWYNFHLPWAAMAMAIMTFGPGNLSLDAAVAAHARKRK
jgi:putative oxidoreductase